MVKNLVKFYFLLIILNILDKIENHNNFDFSNIYTSISHLRLLVRKEAQLYNNLKTFHSKVQQFSDEIRKIINNIEEQIPENILDLTIANKELDYTNDETPEAIFISHPVNSYHVITRMVNNWVKLIQLAKDVSTNLNLGLIHLFEQTEKFWPSYVDEIGVIDSIERLRDFTGLKPKSLYNNSVWNKYNISILKPLEIEDLVTIGLRAYKLRNFEGAISWLTEAISEIDKSESNYDLYKKSVILDYLGWSYFENEKIKEAIEIYKDVIKLDPYNLRAKGNIHRFETQLKFVNNKSKNDESIDIKTLTVDNLNKLDFQMFIKNKTLNLWLQDTMQNISLDAENLYVFESQMAKHVCKNNFLYFKNKEESNLLCYLKSGVIDNHYGSYKIEKIFQNPDVFILNDFLSESEIERIKKISGPRLARAVVHNPKTNALETAGYRISKSSWHGKDEDYVFNNIYRRVEDSTGLYLKYSETFQVQNYGVGGYYDNHFDFMTQKQIKNRKFLSGYEKIGGNRIATLLFYLSNVSVGGETAFPRLGIKVKPSKGSVLFWYNLMPDGTGDARTRHIACPVVFGTKWVGNHWVRINGQERRHSCDLTQNNGL